jgi:photosystem II stability/assembly factor-like uncharacterized protein
MLVWAVGAEGTVLNSEDGGKHWVHRDIIERPNLQAIRPLSNGNSLWALGSGGDLFYSEDHGSNWKAVTLPQRTGEDLFTTADGKHLFVAGGAILFSHGSGRTWATRNSPVEMMRTIGGVVSDSKGRIVLAAGGGYVFRSEDGGTTWSSAVIGFDDTTTVCRDDCRYVWVAGFDGGIASSTDYGKTWHRNLSPTKGWINTLRLGPSARKLLGLAEDSLLYSYPDGRTWLSHPIIRGKKFKAVTTVGPDNRLIAVGEAGEIAESDDSGETWSETQSSAKIESPESIAADTSQRLCLAGDPLISRDRWLACSADGGQTWIDVRSPHIPINTRLEAIASLNAKCWLVVGSNGFALRSDDNGTTWERRELGTAGRLLATGTSQNGTSVVVVGENGNILLSVDRGITWAEAKSGVRSRLTAAYISATGERIVIIGDAGVILVSKDAGQHFSRRSVNSTVDFLVLGSARDGKFLWAAGEGGVILASTDFGETWSRQNDGGPVLNIQALRASENADVVAAVGQLNDKGQILATTDGGRSWNVMFKEPVPTYGILGSYGSRDGIHLWTHSYSSLLHTVVARSGVLPAITQVRISTLATGRARLDIVGDRMAGLEQEGVRIFGANEANRNQLRPLTSVIRKPRSRDAPWTTEFDPAEIGITHGHKLYLDVEISVNGFRHRTSISPDGLIFEPFWFGDNTGASSSPRLWSLLC